MEKYENSDNESSGSWSVASENMSIESPFQLPNVIPRYQDIGSICCFEILNGKYQGKIAITKAFKRQSYDNEYIELEKLKKKIYYLITADDEALILSTSINIDVEEVSIKIKSLINIFIKSNFIIYADLHLIIVNLSLEDISQYFSLMNGKSINYVYTPESKRKVEIAYEHIDRFEKLKRKPNYHKLVECIEQETDNKTELYAKNKEENWKILQKEIDSYIVMHNNRHIKVGNLVGIIDPNLPINFYVKTEKTISPLPLNVDRNINIKRYENCDILINRNDIEKYGYPKETTEEEMIELAIEHNCPIVVKSGRNGKWYLKGKGRSNEFLQSEIEKKLGTFRDGVYTLHLL